MMKGWFFSVKKHSALFFAFLLIVSISACAPRVEEAPSEPEEIESSAEEIEIELEEEEGIKERPTLQAAAENNAQKDENEINLVQLEAPAVGDRIAVISTSLGEITMVLYPQYAPKAVENFTALVEEGFYNGNAFYFAQEGYMVQAGAVKPNGTGSRSTFTDLSGAEKPFGIETGWDLWHFRGAVSLVPGNDGKNGSQFKIIQSPELYMHTERELAQAKYPQKVIDAYTRHGGVPYYDGNSTVFAMVVDGFDVLDAIAGVEVDSAGFPTTPVVIESVTIEAATGESPLEQQASEEASQ